MNGVQQVRPSVFSIAWSILGLTILLRGMLAVCVCVCVCVCFAVSVDLRLCRLARAVPVFHQPCIDTSLQGARLVRAASLSLSPLSSFCVHARVLAVACLHIVLQSPCDLERAW